MYIRPVQESVSRYRIQYVDTFSERILKKYLYLDTFSESIFCLDIFFLRIY